MIINVIAPNTALTTTSEDGFAFKMIGNLIEHYFYEEQDADVLIGKDGETVVKVHISNGLIEVNDIPYSLPYAIDAIEPFV